MTIYATTDAGARWIVVARSRSLSGSRNPGQPRWLWPQWTHLVWELPAVLWLTGTSNVAPCVRESTEAADAGEVPVSLTHRLAGAAQLGLRSYPRSRTVPLQSGTAPRMISHRRLLDDQRRHDLGGASDARPTGECCFFTDMVRC